MCLAAVLIRFFVNLGLIQSSKITYPLFCFYYSILPASVLMDKKRIEWTDIYSTVERLPKDDMVPQEEMKVNIKKINETVKLVEKLAGFKEGTSEKFDGTQTIDEGCVDFLNGISSFVGKPFRTSEGHIIQNQWSPWYWEGGQVTNFKDTAFVIKDSKKHTIERKNQKEILDLFLDETKKPAKVPLKLDTFSTMSGPKFENLEAPLSCGHGNTGFCSLEPVSVPYAVVALFTHLDVNLLEMQELVDGEEVTKKYIVPVFPCQPEKWNSRNISHTRNFCDPTQPHDAYNAGAVFTAIGTSSNELTAGKATLHAYEVGHDKKDSSLVLSTFKETETESQEPNPKKLKKAPENRCKIRPSFDMTPGNDCLTPLNQAYAKPLSMETVNQFYLDVFGSEFEDLYAIVEEHKLSWSRAAMDVKAMFAFGILLQRIAGEFKNMSKASSWLAYYWRLRLVCEKKNLPVSKNTPMDYGDVCFRILVMTNLLTDARISFLDGNLRGTSTLYGLLRLNPPIKVSDLKKLPRRGIVIDDDDFRMKFSAVAKVAHMALANVHVRGDIREPNHFIQVIDDTPYLLDKIQPALQSISANEQKKQVETNALSMTDFMVTFLNAAMAGWQGYQLYGLGEECNQDYLPKLPGFEKCEYLDLSEAVWKKVERMSPANAKQKLVDNQLWAKQIWLYVMDYFSNEKNTDNQFVEAFVRDGVQSMVPKDKQANFLHRINTNDTTAISELHKDFFVKCHFGNGFPERGRHFWTLVSVPAIALQCPTYKHRQYIQNVIDALKKFSEVPEVYEGTPGGLKYYGVEHRDFEEDKTEKHCSGLNLYVVMDDDDEGDDEENPYKLVVSAPSFFRIYHKKIREPGALGFFSTFQKKPTFHFRVVESGCLDISFFPTFQKKLTSSFFLQSPGESAQKTSASRSFLATYVQKFLVAPMAMWDQLWTEAYVEKLGTVSNKNNHRKVDLRIRYLSTILNEICVVIKANGFVIPIVPSLNLEAPMLACFLQNNIFRYKWLNETGIMTEAWQGKLPDEGFFICDNMSPESFSWSNLPNFLYLFLQMAIEESCELQFAPRPERETNKKGVIWEETPAWISPKSPIHAMKKDAPKEPKFSNSLFRAVAFYYHDMVLSFWDLVMLFSSNGTETPSYPRQQGILANLVHDAELFVSGKINENICYELLVKDFFKCMLKSAGGKTGKMKRYLKEEDIPNMLQEMISEHLEIDSDNEEEDTAVPEAATHSETAPAMQNDTPAQNGTATTETPTAEETNDRAEIEQGESVIVLQDRIDELRAAATKEPNASTEGGDGKPKSSKAVFSPETGLHIRTDESTKGGDSKPESKQATNNPDANVVLRTAAMALGAQPTKNDSGIFDTAIQVYLTGLRDVKRNQVAMEAYRTVDERSKKLAESLVHHVAAKAVLATQAGYMKQTVGTAAERAIHEQINKYPTPLMGNLSTNVIIPAVEMFVSTLVRAKLSEEDQKDPAKVGSTFVFDQPPKELFSENYEGEKSQFQEALSKAMGIEAYPIRFNLGEEDGESEDEKKKADETTDEPVFSQQKDPPPPPPPAAGASGTDNGPHGAGGGGAGGGARHGSSENHGGKEKSSNDNQHSGGTPQAGLGADLPSVLEQSEVATVPTPQSENTPLIFSTPESEYNDDYSTQAEGGKSPYTPQRDDKEGGIPSKEFDARPLKSLPVAGSPKPIDQTDAILEEASEPTVHAKPVPAKAPGAGVAASTKPADSDDDSSTDVEVVHTEKPAKGKRGKSKETKGEFDFASDDSELYEGMRQRHDRAKSLSRKSANPKKPASKPKQKAKVNREKKEVAGSDSVRSSSRKRKEPDYLDPVEPKKKRASKPKKEKKRKAVPTTLKAGTVRQEEYFRNLSRSEQD